MATATLNLINSWYATGADTSWTDGGVLFCGTPSQGGNYRTKIAISTADLVIGKSSKLVVAVKLNDECYPAHCQGVLTDLNISNPKNVQNSTSTGPSTELSEAAIALSGACNEDGSAYPSKWVPAGNTFYFVFDTTDLLADTTYYIYVIRAATSDSWVRAAETSIVSTLTYVSYTACTEPTDFLISSRLFNDTVGLSWEGASGGANNPIIAYEIESAISTDGDVWDNWSPVATPTEAPIEDTPDIDRGQYIKYRIRTQGEAGVSYYSDWVESDAARRNSVPSAPTHGSIDKSEYSPGDSITLTWQGASDVDNNISEYRIYAGISELGEDAPANWGLLAEVSSQSDGASYTFIPSRVGYHQVLHLKVQTVDSFECTSSDLVLGQVYRNDDPLIRIFSGYHPQNNACIEDGALVVTGSGSAVIADGNILRAEGQVAFVSATNGVLVAREAWTSELFCIYLFENESTACKYMPYIHDGARWVRYSDGAV